MSVLANPRHERFVHHLALGETAECAYREAGYKPDRGHAARLAANGSVRRRLGELQSRAAIRAEITIAVMTEWLLDLAGRAEAMAAGGQGPAALQVARAAIMDVAKLNGLLVERTQKNVDERRDVREFTDAELTVILRERIAEAPAKQGLAPQE